MSTARSSTLSALALTLQLLPSGTPEGKADLDRRAAALHRRAAATAPGTPAARELSGDLARLGEACLEQQETGRAIEILVQACALDAGNGQALATLTLAYVRAEDFSAARFYLDLARQNAPGAPPAIYRMLAQVYESLHRLEDAVDAFEEFVRLSGEEPAVLERLARLKAELALGAAQRILESGDFTVFYDAAIPFATAESAGAALAQSYKTQSALLGTALPERQPVILYTGRAYFALASVPDWVSGVFDGKIRVCLDAAAGQTPELAAVLAHELAHALIRRASADRAPGWLHEGLAQWLEGRRLTRREFRQIFAGQKVLALVELDGLFGRQLDRVHARRHYAEMLGLVEYLAAERGEGAVACLVRGLAEQRPAEEILRRETGFSSDALVAGWKAWAGLSGKGVPP
jgi:tetratricopeptide (TPR) repeat protein